jgi:NAD(P)-dependent dehydrogenase (short-subunit alcohol dehydrogenase family)
MSRKEETMDLNLKDKVAFVTGAGSQNGYGKAICLTLAKEGCDIIVADRDLVGAKQTTALVEAWGRKALALKADVTRSSDVNEIVKSALEKFQRIDILVNNAGGASAPKPFVEKTEADWDFDFNLNMRGVLNCTKAILPQMLASKSGKIVNIASGAGKIGLEYHSSYSAAKGGVITFTRVLAREVASFGINVNCIAPGIGDTNFLIAGKVPREFFDQAVQLVPLKRATSPQDIANVAAFLVSDVSSYILGQTLSVDGGATMS